MLRAASTAARRTSTRAFTSTRAAQDFYPGIDKIQYEGKASNNPLAFKHYNADEIIMGKTMKEVRVCCDAQAHIRTDASTHTDTPHTPHVQLHRRRSLDTVRYPLVRTHRSDTPLTSPKHL